METEHRVLFNDAADLTAVEDASVQLVVTSPPYPMIEMWDDTFTKLDRRVRFAIDSEDAMHAFDLMHARLDAVWKECVRVVAPGGIVCINIGDAVRTVGEDFRLFANHARIIQWFTAHGYSMLPSILWRKPTNAPNKFMGSGMLPPGAYVTLEHEHILVFRNGGKRTFGTDDEKAGRRASAFFWEERNRWFSDVWTIGSERQALADPASRARSGAYPFTLAYRLVSMFSVAGDTVLDPFLGTGTTLAACVAAGRNGIGIEVDESLAPTIAATMQAAAAVSARAVADRLADHDAFVKAREKPPGYVNRAHNVPVVTKQEVELALRAPAAVQKAGAGVWRATYAPPVRTTQPVQDDDAPVTMQVVTDGADAP